MDRRTFLFSAAAAGAPQQLPKTDGIELRGSTHPRVRSAAEGLAEQLRSLGLDSSARRITLEVRAGLATEHFEITGGRGITVTAGGDRGLVYGISELSRQIARLRKLPDQVSLRRSPRFAVRRWSTSVSHLFGSPWDERIMLLERFDFIRSEVLPRAAAFGLNSVELNGRPGDGWDVAWIIGFEKYSELARLYPEGERRRRVALVEELGRAAHENLLDFLVWSHELYLPPGFVELYPEVRGTDYPVCLSSELLKRFVRDKYIEFFEGAPSVDGIVISVNESGQFSLITDAGCKCDRCARLTQHERLMAVLNQVVDVCTRMKKQLVLRTFQSAWVHDLDGHPELETIRKAYTGLPGHVQVMSKYCPLDFYGGAIADEPLIGAFPNPHLVEFSLDVEWQGRTFVPVLTPSNFRRRINFALEKKCAGIVARVDFPFPSMEPGPIFGHPNEFNAVYMSELLWADSDPGESILRWTSSRYGAEAAAQVAPALLSTEEITQKTFFAQGQTVINYHNMIAGLSHADNNLWNHALSKWDRSKRELSRLFFQPSDELIARCKEEKRQAASVAAEGLRRIEQARGLSPLERERLRCDFEKLHDTAVLWGLLTELYLRNRQEGATVPRLYAAAASALETAVRMEARYGRNSWPVVSPDRGVTAYEFVHQVLRKHVSAFTGEPAAEAVQYRYADNVLTAPVVESDSTEEFWRRLVELGRPRFAYGSSTALTLRWPAKLAGVRLEDRSLVLVAQGGEELKLPLAYAVRAVALKPAPRLVVRVAKTTRHLEVEL